MIDLDKSHLRKLQMESKGEGVKSRAENDDLLDALMETGTNSLFDISFAKQEVELNP